MKISVENLQIIAKQIPLFKIFKPYQSKKYSFDIIDYDLTLRLHDCNIIDWTH